MSAGEILFSTVGGLRGAISLILAQMLVTQSHPNPEQKDQQRVQAQVRPLNRRLLFCILSTLASELSAEVAGF